MQARNYYAILKVNENASSTEIRLAYKKLVFQHPDKHMNDPNASQEFSAIHEAYEVLYNVNKRVQYDSERKKQALSLLSPEQSSASFFTPNLVSMVEALYKQFLDQMVTADFTDEKSASIGFNLAGLTPAHQESFKSQIVRIVDTLGNGVVRQATTNHFQIELGFDNPEKTKYLMGLIEKTAEKAYVDAIESAKEFLRKSR